MLSSQQKESRTNSRNATDPWSTTAAPLRSASAKAQSEEMHSIVDGVDGNDSAPVQAKTDASLDRDPAAIHDAARAGVSAASSPLPHQDVIQRSFGQKFDLSAVRTNVGGAAADASSKMGAAAYTTGGKVAFKSAPDLHTAAHEAAHVIQQKHGVQLSNGIGQSGDSYEQHADAVADRVVQGRSASDLLTPLQTGSSRQAVQQLVQQKKEPSKEELAQMKKDLVALVKHPRLKSLRADYETKVKGFKTDAEAGVKALKMNVDAFWEAAKPDRAGPTHLPKKEDTKLGKLAHKLCQARLDLTSSTKLETPVPVREFIFHANLSRGYPNKWGATYDYLRDEKMKTNAQVIGGACRPNPDINKFLAAYTPWLGKQTTQTIIKFHKAAEEYRKAG